MLHPRPTIPIHILLDLALPLPLCGLIDWHFDDFVRRRHHHAPQRGEFGADVVVVNAPEAVKAEALLVEVAGRVHGGPVLVADAVVDGFEVYLREEKIDWVRGGDWVDLMSVMGEA